MPDPAKKVLILSNQFPPSGGPGVQRMAKFVRYLPAAGWVPTVLAAEPDGKGPYDGELLQELADGLEIYRFPDFVIPPALNRRVVRALVRALFQPDPHRVWAQRALPIARKLLGDGSFAAVLSTDPAGAHWLGWKLKQEFGLPWIMDIRDLWTGAFTYRPVSFLHAALDSWYERSFLAVADRVVCATEGYPSVLKQLHPDIPFQKYVVIPNGFDDADFSSEVQKSGNEFLISYVGSVYAFHVRPRPSGWMRLFEPLSASGPEVPIRSPEPLLKAIRTLLDQNPGAKEKVRLRFVGSFPDVYRKMLRGYGLEEIVEFTGYVQHAEAVAEMRQASVLVLIQDGAGSEVVIPGKLYEYLRSGTPVLGMLREGLAAQLIRESAAGEVIHPENKEGAGCLLSDWYRYWKTGEAVFHPDIAYIQRFSRRQQTTALVETLEQIIL